MKRISILLAALALSAFTATAQQAVNDVKFGKGLLNYVAQDSSFSVKFAPRMQYRYYGDYDMGGENIDHTFVLRRSRFKFGGWVVNPNIVYKMEFGLSNNDLSGGNDYTKGAPRMILDAVIKYKFAPGWEFWAGQTKLPGNVERVVSSANLQLVDRSRLNSRFNIDRDLGVHLRHKSKLPMGMVTKEKFAISQGEGRNITGGNVGGLQYTARLEFLPFGEFAKKGDYTHAALVREETPKLMLAYTYNFNADAVKTRGNMGDYMYLADGSFYHTDITTHFVDAVMKYKGISFQGEWTTRSAAAAVAVEADGTATGDVVLTGGGYSAQLGYMLTDHYEVVGRYTSLAFGQETGKDPFTQYTAGFNNYIVGHKLKVQSDISYIIDEKGNEGVAFRLGFDLHF